MAKLLVHILGTILITSVLCSAQVPDPSETEVEASGDTTSSAVPSPSTTPTPLLPPSPETYLLRNGSGIVCVYINASISFLVSYPHDSKQNETVQIVPVHPQTIANDSFCNDTAATLTVEWATDHVEQNGTMSFIFAANTDSKTWKLSSVNVTIPGAAFKGAEYPVGMLDVGIDQLMDMQDFQLSYLCDTGRNLSMEVLNRTAPNVTHYDVQITLKDFQVQAFHFKNSSLIEFDDFARCAEDIKGSKIVPIAVGAALAGLVIIVLIAYIIGRLRSRKQGSYEALS